MKKYIILVILLFLYFDKVYADEICTENLIDMGYNYISEDDNYKYNKDDFIINYGDWQDYNDEELENSERKIFYRYNKIPKARYIHIYNTKFGTYNFNISEFEILINGTKINYEKECMYCNIDTLKYIDDNNYDYDKQLTLNFLTGHLIVDLLDEYELEDIKINLYLNDNTVYIKQFNVGFSNSKDKNELIVKEFIYEDFSSNNESILFEYKVNDSWDVNDNYLTIYETDELIEDNIFYKKIDEYQKYRLVDIKYKTYLIEKICEENNNIPIVKEDNKPIIQNLSVKPSIKNIIQTKETIKPEIKESKITFIGNDTYREITKYETIHTKKSNNNLLISIYFLVIINSVIILILINSKKMSYEK